MKLESRIGKGAAFCSEITSDLPGNQQGGALNEHILRAHHRCTRAKFDVLSDVTMGEQTQSLLLTKHIYN